MSKVPNRRCPSCVSMGRDKGSDKGHLFLLKDGNAYFCTRCKYREPVEDTQMSIPKVEFKTAKIKMGKSDAMKLDLIKKKDQAAIKDRNISKLTVQKFGVVMDSVSQYYPMTKSHKVTGYKHRKLPKTIFTVGDCAGDDLQLFGQYIFPKGGKKVIIAFGELDAMSCYEMLKSTKYFSPAWAFVSPPRGENFNDVANQREYLDSFDEIIVAPDQDTAGMKLCDSIVKLFGPKVKVMELKHSFLDIKDPSDMLQNNLQSEFVNFFFKAQPQRPPSIIKPSDIDDEYITTEEEWGLEYPWRALTMHTFGIKTGRVIGIGGAPGCGKTTFINQIEQALMFDYNEPIGVFDLEETPKKCLKKLIGQIMNKRIHLPGVDYDKEEALRIKKKVEDKLYLFDFDEIDSWPEIKFNIRYLHSLGVKYFFIDPISALHGHLEPSEANTFLTKIMLEMKDLRKKYDLTIFHNNHLNNPKTGKDHGAGGKIYGGQFSGSRAQWKFSTDVWALVRDQTSDDEKVKNTMEVGVIKAREGETGNFELFYSKNKGILLEDWDYM